MADCLMAGLGGLYHLFHPLIGASPAPGGRSLAYGADICVLQCPAGCSGRAFGPVYLGLKYRK